MLIITVIGFWFVVPRGIPYFWFILLFFKHLTIFLNHKLSKICLILLNISFSGTLNHEKYCFKFQIKKSIYATIEIFFFNFITEKTVILQKQ